MKEYPISFTVEMLRLVIERRKTQTRRVAYRWQAGRLRRAATMWECASAGDRLWIREPIYLDDRLLYNTGRAETRYLLDAGHACRRGRPFQWHWRRATLPAMFMPRELARHFATIREIYFTRLLDITEAGAGSEGFASVEEFLAYWDKLNRHRVGCCSGAEPDVWVISFELERKA